MAVVQPLVFAFVLLGLGLPSATAYASFACFGLLALADFGGTRRDRLVAYLTVGVLGLPLVVLGSVASAHLVAAVIAAFVVAAATVYLTMLRSYVAAGAVPLLLPFVLAITSPWDPGQIGPRCLGWAIGAVASAIAAVVLWPSFPVNRQRTALATALLAAADIVRCRWSAVTDIEPDLVALGDAAAALRVAYDGELARPGNVTSRDRSLVLAIDEFSRLVSILRWTPDPTENPLAVDRELADLTAGTLDQAARALLGESSAPDAAGLNQGREIHEAVVEAWVQEEFENERALVAGQHVRSMFRLRIVALSAQSIAGNVAGSLGQRGGESDATVTLGGHRLWDPVTAPSRTASLRSQFRWSSPWFRNALRSGVAVALAVLVVGVTDTEHGFWVVLGTLTALRFDAAGTGRTAWQILVGTIGGFIVGIGIIFLAGSDEPVLWAILPITVFLSAYTPGAISLAVGQASFTAFTITLFALFSPDGFATADFRLLDVVLALGVSLMVSALLWPRGVVPVVNRVLNDAASHCGDYLVAAFRRLTSGAALEPLVAQRSLESARALDLADETFDLAYSQAGPGLPAIGTWGSLVNTSANVAYAAQVVLSVARNGRSTGGDVECQAAFLRAAEEIGTHYTAAVRALTSAAPSGDDRFDLDDLRRQVDRNLLAWQARPTPADAIAATSLVWLEDWILYTHWLTNSPPLQ